MPLPEGSVASEERWIQHLSSLYQLEFSLLAVAAAVAAVGSPLVVGFLVNLPTPCKGSTTTSCLTSQQLVLLPIIPFLLLMSFGYIYFNSRVVGAYTRDLERTISGDVVAPGAELTVPALSRLNGALFGGESKHLLPLRIFYVILAGSVVLVSLVAALLTISRIPDTWLRNTGWVVYGGIGLCCLLAYNAGASHRLFYRLRSAAKVRDMQKASPPTSDAKRSWLSFLGFAILPRFRSVSKEQHAIALALAAAIVGGGFDGFPWIRFVAGMLLFELLLYQTRYLLNGVREDPNAGPQLPGNRNDSALAFTPLQGLTAIAISALRIWLFCFAVTTLNLLPRDAAVAVSMLFVISFYFYEIPREWARYKYRELMARHVPDGPTGLPQQELRELCRGQIRLGPVMFVAAGAGYALRGLMALLLMHGGQLRVSPNAAFVVIAWTLGCALVGAGWAREFTAAVASAPGRPVLHPGIAAKPHLLWAGRFLNRFALADVHFEILPIDETEWKGDRPLGCYLGTGRGPWRLACALSLVGVGLIAPTGNDLSVPLLLLMLVVASYLVLAAGEDVMFPPFALLISAVGCAVIAVKSEMSLWWGTGAAATAFWILFQMSQNEKNSYADLMQQSSAEVITKSRRTINIGRRLRMLVELLIGGAFVRSAHKIFGRS